MALLVVTLGCGGGGGDPSGPAIDPVVITTTGMVDGVRGVPYTDTLVATGGLGGRFWTIVGGALPAGLTLGATSGIVTGTPTVVGLATFTTKVTIGTQSTTQQVSLDIEDRPTLLPTESCSGRPWYTIAAFAHTALTARVRTEALLAPTDDLTCQVVTALNVPFHADFQALTSIVGVQNLVGLTELYISYNTFGDASPVAALTGLKKLVLNSDNITSLAPVSGLTGLTYFSADQNAITSVAPLSGLTALDLLSLGINSISDLQPLSGLVNLTWLDLHANEVASLAGLAGMTKLQHLNLFDNVVTDISVLAGLTALTYINLEYNPGLVSIQPLLDNTGLGSGDRVILYSTAVSCAQVYALQAKGITVSASC